MNSKLFQALKNFSIYTLAAVAVMSTASVAKADRWGCERRVGVIGAIIGGIIGAQIGHGDGRTIATIGGALIGSAVDRNIVCQMREEEREDMEYSMHSCLERRYDPDALQCDPWSGPTYGGGFRIISQGYANQNYCREIESTIYRPDNYGRPVPVQTVTTLQCMRGPGMWYRETHYSVYRRQY